MKILIFLLPILLNPVALKAQTTPRLKDLSCIECHTKEYSGFKNDLHHVRGDLLCVDCHGGDGTSADEDTSMYLAADWAGRPAPNQVASFCGRCHESVLSAFSKSENAARFGITEIVVPRAKPLSREQSLDPKAPSEGTWKACASCHGVHGMKTAGPELIRTASKQYDQAVLVPEFATALERAETIVDSLTASAEVFSEKGHPLNPVFWIELDSLSAAVHALEIGQHSMDTATVGVLTSRVAGFAARARKIIEEAKSAQTGREIGLVYMWGFIAVAVVVFYVRQKKLTVTAAKSNTESRT